MTTTWLNTGVTPEDIRRVFYRQPCLVCVFAKRNKDSKLIWARRPAQPSSPAEPPPPISPSPTIIPRPDTKLDTAIFLHSPPPPNVDTERNDSQWETGPESIEGYRQFITFRDTRSKYLFCYPVKTCNEDTFFYHLQRVLRFFTSRGFKPRILLRSDYYTTFRSAKANQFYEDNQCRHESSAPYQQWQNAVERDIFKLSYPTSWQPSTGKTLCAPTFGPTPLPTGHAFIMLSNMQFYATYQRA